MDRGRTNRVKWYNEEEARWIMKIGYAYLVADVLHRGHILHIKNCSNLCDYLICGILTDEAAMEKKPKPIVSFDERVELVSAIRYVSAVVCQDTYSPLKNCKTIKPDILFECGTHEEMPANDFVRSYGGKVIVMPYYSGQSSTQIKRRVRDEKCDCCSS